MTLGRDAAAVVQNATSAFLAAEARGRRGASHADGHGVICELVTSAGCFAIT